MILNLYEWQAESFSVEEDLRSGLQSYLEEAWMNRPLLYDTSEDDDEEEPGEPVQRFLDFKPGTIKARNYVGFIQFENIRINIEPKIFEGRDDLTVENKIANLLQWLSYSRRIHFPFLDSFFDADNSHHDWLEAFIFLFANYTESILSSSPYMAYQEVTEETAYIKGRLQMNEYVQQNLARARHQRVYCTYEPFVYDNQFNRVVKHTCKYLAGITKAEENNRLLQEIIFLLDDAEDQYCTVADCDKVQVNRMFPEVERITNLCKLFLANQSYNSYSSDTNNLCVLLPMEVIFEEFVFGFMEKHFNYLHPVRQASDMHLAQTVSSNPAWVFQMKHDILIPGKLIIDTKYKFRQKTEDRKRGINQSDLYQMIAYAYRRNMKEVLLLYPYFGVADNDPAIFNIAPQNEEFRRINVSAASLDIVVESELFENKIKERIKRLHRLFHQ